MFYIHCRLDKTKFALFLSISQFAAFILLPNTLQESKP